MTRRRGVARVPLARVAGCAAAVLALGLVARPADAAELSDGATSAPRPTVGLALAGEVQLTPLLVAPLSQPVPVRGADGRTHLLYELLLTNATRGPVRLGAITVRGDGEVLATIPAEEAARSLQLLGERTPTAVLEQAQAGVLFLALALAEGQAVPAHLEHEMALEAKSVPGGPHVVQRAGDVAVDRTRVVPVLSPPLEPGAGYMPADGCCTAVRHIRAGLPVDGKLAYAQRFAIDWEQIDAERRFVNGDPADPASYTIYGKQVLAAADGRVVEAVDGLPNQVPGALPAGLTLAQADGNAVVQHIGGGAFALYAHLQPGSLRVKRGEMLRRGDVIGLVGNSGNSSAPHLHFHVMDGPSPLASNGLPHVIDRFLVTGSYPSTEAFDAVENTTTPLAVTPASGAPQRANVLPLDLSVVEFPR